MLSFLKRSSLVLAGALAALPALAQTTTTVTSQPQQAAPPPPPPTTQVVVNPNDPAPPPATVTHVRVNDDALGVEVHHDTRSSAAIIATDAVYGGLTGLLVGGGVTLIDQGNYWQRDLMVGAGAGILAGAAFGIYEAATRPDPYVRRASVDPDPGASSGTNFSLLTRKF